MRADLEIHCAHPDGHGRELARSLYTRERLITRLAESSLDPVGFDLNPHLQIETVVDLVIADVKEMRFPEGTREEVYLLWLTTCVFKGLGPPGVPCWHGNMRAPGTCFECTEQAAMQDPVVREAARKNAEQRGYERGLAEVEKLIGHIEASIPYVTSTLCRQNTFPIEKVGKSFHGDPTELAGRS